MQSEGTSDDDAPPVAGKQIHADDDCNDEVPSSFPIVRPSNRLDFEEDDDDIDEDADASSDDEDVSLAVIAKKSQAGGKGAKKKTTSQGGKTVRSSFAIVLFILSLLFFNC